MAIMTFHFPVFILAQNDIEWQLKYHETFDEPIEEPVSWVEDTYGKESQWHVGPFDEDGEYFHYKYGDAFQDQLNDFRSYRKSFSYGKDDWLTIELYGKDEDKDGFPESGGRFKAKEGLANLIVSKHTDGAIIRSASQLPSEYKIEITVSNIDFGGDKNMDGNWEEQGKYNGYDGDEFAGPWLLNSKGDPYKSTTENGLYFLCITDYANPAPHNNIFIHHHRKVVMDTDFNYDNGYSWSQIYNTKAGIFEADGNGYVGMIWLNGDDFGSDNNGNGFSSWTNQGWQDGAKFPDKFIPNEEYTFIIERSGEAYTMSVSGKFYYAGEYTYAKSRKFDDEPPIWHYNQNSNEYDGVYNQTKAYGEYSFDTWPSDSEYPDYFFFGDPHINFYEGQASYDNLKFYIPKNKVLSINEEKEVNLVAYPNPFNSELALSINLDVPALVSVDIVSINGNIVLKIPIQPVSTGSFEVKPHFPPTLKPGIYFAKVMIHTKTGTLNRTIKLLKY